VFREWAEGVATAHGYTVTLAGIGTEDPEGRGTPTQMAVLDVLKLSPVPRGSQGINW
jgi:hypothetical protein